ncbi:uncharacterized protein LOC117342947 [Pecten maximus]|uniref:uncharacterized protein LOC117342947 n=1 Tax=Pecten maximus TaxID=6579 RepID=UPI001458BC66|nr:uncharacterized protein LOC117342947 [Pecten maximus]
MATETSSDKCDVCAVFDECYLAKVEEVILTPIKDRGITCCDIERDISPGQPRLEGIYNLLARSESVLVIHPIPEELLNMLKHVQSRGIMFKHCISLTFGRKHKSYQEGIIDISRTPNWLDEVLHRMSSPTPTIGENNTAAILCRSPPTTRFLDVLFTTGCLSISSTDMNILGIQILPSKKEVKLDLNYCMQNIESHEKYKTHQVIEMLRSIRSLSTEVELRIDAEEKDMINIVSRSVDKIFSTICSCVFDVRDRKLHEWIVAYRLSGPLVFDRQFIARIYHSSRHAIIGSSFPDKVQYPDFSDEEKRKETFSSTIFHNKATLMAEAGFFFDGLTDRARCYHCGGARIGWKKSDDPWVMHAEGFPKCPLVKENMSEDVIEKIVKSEFEKTLAGNLDYESVDKRKSTLDDMLIMSACKKNNVCIEKYRRDVAEAGFYYVGPEDRVRCFSCGIMISGIRSRTFQELLVEHACVSPSCAHVRSKLPPDKLQFVFDTRAVSSEFLSVIFFVKTYDRIQSNWPSNMLCS